MINYNQLQDLVTELLLEWGLFKPLARDAIMMVIAHESNGGSYLKQIGGPALGFIQMEPETHDSIWKNSDTIKDRAERFGVKNDSRLLTRSIEYNVWMARHYFLMDENPFPKDLKSMSVYLKNYWNSAGGKARPDDYYRAYKFWRQV